MSSARGTRSGAWDSKATQGTGREGGSGAAAPWTMRFTSDLAMWLPSPTTSQMYFPVSSRVTVLKWMVVGENWTRFLYGSAKREEMGLGTGSDGWTDGQTTLSRGGSQGRTCQLSPIVEEDQ